MRDSSIPTVPDHEVVIVGAGFAGMSAAIKLKKAGIRDFVILERDDEVGGVWQHNTYPGVAVDIPSFTYSYHFEPNPNWSRVFAPGEELRQYARDTADKYGLRSHLRFNSEVTSARFDEDAHLWRLDLADGQTLTARFLFSCHGCLNTPNQPQIPGLEEFGGHTIYTMRWDHDYDLRGKRVAIIGTGASALQVIPEIAPQVASLQVYQRTPIWVMPKVNPKVPGLVRGALGTLPLAQKSLRWAANGGSELLLTLGGLYYKEMPFIVDSVEKMCRAFLRAQVPDPVLREKLTPKYAFGCKRPSFSNTYYKTFLRENVELVTDGIETVTPTGIRTVDGAEREIDTLILATGFKVFDVPYDLYGTDGVTLNDLWHDQRKHSYEGTTVHGYPNMFLGTGPYGVTGSSVFASFDLCLDHAVRVVTAARKRGATRVEVKTAAQARFLAAMRSRVPHTLFLNPLCAGSNTYYIDEHGDSPFLRPTAGLHAWWAQRTFDLDDYSFETPPRVVAADPESGVVHLSGRTRSRRKTAAANSAPLV